ncbi:MAG: response regulator [Candidatus Cohnella colombiensis]|uniref:Response regulator n=1 Tax=Candidatus Cohnella colombiensis TaxID=3121368 RepID=A0AA95EY33_9BACL|nr:MAG: response regulator [Cohnella sp.]
MIPPKFKQLVEQRIRGTFDDWASKGSIEETEIYRFLHNLKGTAGTIGMKAIEREADHLLGLFSDVSRRLFDYGECFDLLKGLLLELPQEGDQEQLEDSELTTSTAGSSQIGNRILVIDDDVELAAYLKAVLEERNYPVNIALSAERGLKMFYDLKPDMILLDIFLPDTNGLEVLKQIVEKSHQEHSPVIVISSEDTKTHRINAYRFGAMDFFAKPIDQELLLALIDNRFKIKQQWEQSIIVDELTGAYNRKYFNRTLRQLIMDFQRTKRVFTIAIMDLDHFKRVNDTYGHLKGDEVLRSFAEVVMELKREEDSLCRYGGEEFALLLPNTSKEQAVHVLDRIRERLSARLFEADGGPFQVTFTSGVTDIHLDNMHAEQLVEEADQALYVGKESGRNQTVIFAPQLISHNYEQMLNIVVVDDDPLIRELVVSELSQWQPNRSLEVAVKSYDNGVEFLQSDWFKEKQKYIILLDGAMPTMDGVEVLNELRVQYQERDIVIAMLTARGNQTDIIHALQHGADDYIIKPFQMTELVARVERLVHKLFK